jgi:hypothetical protein
MVTFTEHKMGILKCLCYAHGNVCKLCGWFDNSWRVGSSWPRSSHPLVRSLSLSSPPPTMPWGVESFTLAAPLHCDRVEFLRCGDGSKTRGTVAVWTITQPEHKCIAGLFGVFFWLWITYYSLQSSVYVNWAPWTGYIPLV